METILVIDDEKNIRKIICSQLASGGRKAVESTNREDALSILKTQHIDAVICDIKLAEGSGIEVLREIRKNWEAMPVIMLTGYIDREYFELSKQLGCYDVLIKPVRKEKLLEVLDNIARSC